jgi:hypothetical protein
MDTLSTDKMALVSFSGVLFKRSVRSIDSRDVCHLCCVLDPNMSPAVHAADLRLSPAVKTRAAALSSKRGSEVRKDWKTSNAFIRSARQCAPDQHASQDSQDGLPAIRRRRGAEAPACTRPACRSPCLQENGLFAVQKPLPLPEALPPGLKSQLRSAAS